MADGVVDAVVEVFRSELALPGCGPDESFFQLGGDSLLATRVLARLNERFAVRVPFAEMYRDSTPAALAGVIERLGSAPAPRRSIAALARRRRGARFPLAMSQQAIHAMDVATGGAGLFNNVGVLRFTGDVDPHRITAAVADTVRRHSALRLVFGDEHGTPVQSCTDDVPEIGTGDLRGSAAENRLDRLVRRERLLGFDLRSAPPVRFVLVRLADDAWALVATFHHIVFDGMSQSLFVDDLAHAYACRLGSGTPRPPLRWDYLDFAEWQRDTLRGDRLDAHLDALHRTLAGPPAPRLSGPQQPEEPDSFRCRIRSYAVDHDVSAALRALAASCDTTLFVALLAAVLDFTGRRSGAPQPVVAVQASNRGVEGAERVIGCFANSVHVAVDGAGPADPADRVRAAKAAVGEALLHQELPIEVALRLLAERGVALPEPQLGFALQPHARTVHELPGGRLDADFPGQRGDAVDPTSFALVLELFDVDGELRGATHHRLADWSAADADSSITALSAAFAGLADAAARTVESPQ